MTYKLCQFLVMVLVPLLLSGCLFGRDGYIHDRRDIYRKSQSQPRLALPKDSKPANMDDALSIPAGRVAQPGEAPSMLPPGSERWLGTSEKAKASHAVTATLVERRGQPQLKVNANYTTAWSKVNTALEQLGYQIIGGDKRSELLEVVPPSHGKTASQIYQFIFARHDGAVYLKVLEQSGSTASARVAKPMLIALRDQIIRK